MTNSNTTYTRRSDEPVSSKASPVAGALIAMIGVYQRLTAGRPSPCRFYPSCSELRG